MSGVLPSVATFEYGKIGPIKYAMPERCGNSLGRGAEGWNPPMRDQCTAPAVVCAACGKAFQNPRLSRPRRFCSLSCFLATRRALPSDFRVTCVVCGTGFRPRPGRRETAKWCSRRCADNAFPALERLARLTDKKGPIPDYRPDLGPCWFWLGRLNGGYGQISVNGKLRPSHVYMYEVCVGLVPLGLQLDHLCRVPRCVNPQHLEPVTSRVNSLRGESFAAKNAAKTHCPRGHEYTAENTGRAGPNGRGRYCKACRKIPRVKKEMVGKGC